MSVLPVVIWVFFNREFRRDLLASLRLRGGRGGFRCSSVFGDWFLVFGSKMLSPFY